MGTAKKKVTKKKVSKKATKKRATTGVGRGHGKTVDVLSQLTQKDKASLPARARTNKAMRYEDLRERIDGARTINAIHEATDELISLNEEVKNAKNTTKDSTVVGVTIEKAKTRNTILKNVLDAKFKLLAKKLPDLRSLEVVDQDGNNLFTAFIDAVKDNQEGNK